MGSRRYSLVVLIALAGCEFDPSGTGRSDGDDTGTVDGAPGDAPRPAIDAAPTTPVDASDTPGPVTCGPVTCGPGTICCLDIGGPSCTTEAACGGATQSCDEPDDCDGEDCCMYAGITTACSPTCIGGDQVCETASDCGGLAGQCCASSLGPKVCGLVCL